MDGATLDPQALIASLADVVTSWGLKVLGALVLLIAGRMLAGWARKTARAALKRSKMDDTLVPFVASMVYYTLFGFVLIAVLGMVGIQTASIIALLGAVGLAVGFALQGTLANFASGLMLLVFRPFRKGDFIEAGGVAGSVEAINIFTTMLNTPDNVGIVIPNATVWGQTIKNYAANPTRRIDLVVGISYGDDIGKAIDTITGVLQADARIMTDPAPTVAVTELADSSVNLVVRPWCKREDYWPIRFDLTRRLKEELERCGCSIPFPQHDVHLAQSGASAA